VIPVRRLAAALREMRWGHVFVELALLIAGILIALAVDGWIDARRDVRTERQYLELLVRDLDQDREVLDEVLAFEEAQAAAAALAYRALRDGVAPQDRETIAAALGQLTARRTLRLARATYTDLLSTGNLHLIRNADLRDRIVRLYETNERVQLIRDRNNQEFVDRMYMTYLLDAGLVAPRPERRLPSIAAADGKFAKRTGTTVDTGDDRLWRLAPDAPEWGVLSGRVWYRGLVSEGAIEQSQQMATEIGAVREAIQDELSTRRWP
jgi:hypothetical protein